MEKSVRPAMPGIVFTIAALAAGCSAAPAAIESPPPGSATGQTWARPRDSMVMVYVPPGTLDMGSPGDSPEADPDEYPSHAVAVDGFLIDSTEVTVAQFRLFVTSAGYETEAEIEGWSGVWSGTSWQQVEGASWEQPGGPGTRAPDSHPVTQVGWTDAAAYCEWVGAELPTEAQWEYAARGAEGRIYPWGDGFDGTRLNYCDVNCSLGWSDGGQDDGHPTTSPAGSYGGGASWCGALDLAGNVWEWVGDWYDAGYYATRPAGNSTGPERGQARVMRGGSWGNDSSDVRSANRSGSPPGTRLPSIGFRCAMAPPSGQ
jgi:formylglycine-generating enzyme required for sulfatase activity